MDDAINEVKQFKPSFPERLFVWINAGGKKAYLSYTFLFVAFFVLFASGLFINGKGFIWYVDGLEQQYMFFVMQGEWFRELLSNIFLKHELVVPMWSDRVGYGADYVLSIQNTIGNPINWISVFFTAKTADIGLNLTVPLTLYIAGLCFLGYCDFKKWDRNSSLIACFVYLFGGFSLIAFFQIYMLYPLILGSLVLWGVDKVFAKQSPVLFVLAVALCFFCSVNMAYNACLLLFIYCLVKVFNLGEKLTVKAFLVWVLKIAGLIALGCLIGCIQFIPGAISILSQDRLSLDRPDMLLYSLATYLSFFTGFINAASVGADCYYGFAPIALLCVVALVCKKAESSNDRKARRVLIVLFCIFTIAMCLPLAGRIFNGFAYANNRWVWAYALLVSCIVACCLPSLREQLMKGGRKIIVAICAYVVVCTVVLILYIGKEILLSICVLLLAGLLCFVFAKKRVLFDFAVLCTVALSCFVVFFLSGDAVSPNQVGLTRSYTSAYTQNPSSAVAESVEEPDDARYDGAKAFLYRNGNWANGMESQTFYNSIYNSYVDEYHTSLGLATSSMNFAYCTLNSRSTMEALGGTEYFVTLADDDSYLPPEFDEKIGEKVIRETDYAVYEANETLPLAFLYDSAVSKDFYESLSLMERQDLLTQKVALDDVHEDTEFEQYSFEIPSELSYAKPEGGDVFAVADPQPVTVKEASTKIDGNTITIQQANTILYLDAEIPANTEAYFVCEGMDFRELADDEKQDSAAGIKQKREALQADLLKSEAKECKIIVYGDNTSQEIWFMNNKHHLYGGKNDWAVNVGYSDDERHGIALLFDTPGVYSFDSYGVFALDTMNVAEDVEELAQQTAQDIREVDNGYLCNVDVAQNGEYLYFRVPYGEGWTATVNGESAQIIKANLGFMAIPLDEGHYSVELHYETPGLTLGAVLSAVGIMGFIVMVAIVRRQGGKAR